MKLIYIVHDNNTDLVLTYDFTIRKVECMNY